jgi:hypothetical protein
VSFRVLISALAFMVMGVSAQQRPSLAVMDVQAVGFADRGTQVSLQEKIISIAGGLDRAEVLSAGEYRKRALDGALMVPVECDAQCFSEVGAKLGVDLVLQADVQRESSGLTVNFRLFDVAGKRLVREEKTLAGGNIGAQLQYGVECVLAGAPSQAGSSSISKQAWIAGGLGIGMAVVAGVLVLTAPIDEEASVTNHYEVTTPLATATTP